MPRTVRAVAALTARTAGWLPPGANTTLGVGRRPPSAIVAATVAISRGLACTMSWPIAVEPTASSPWICAAGGRVLSAAPAIPGGWLKPNRSAVATSRAAPSFTPSGANTELHDTANASTRVPPHSSPLALCSSTPSSVASVASANVLRGLATPACSTPLTVTILNVDPGGCSASKAMPATASTWPLAGSSAITPPYWPPSALTAALCNVGEIVVRTVLPARGATLASTRSLPAVAVLAVAVPVVAVPVVGDWPAGAWTASSSPPGVPRRRSSSASSRPLTPTIALPGTPCASSAWRLPAGIGPTSPATASAAAPSGELRCPAALAGPSASADPLRASSAALGGSSVRLLNTSPARRPGKASERDHATRSPPSSGSATTGSLKLSARVPHSRVRTRTGTTSTPPAAARGAPITRYAAGGRRHQVFAVGLREFARPDLSLGGGGELAVHRRVVTPCPRRREARRERGGGRGGGVLRAHDRPHRERHRRQRDHRSGTPCAPAARALEVPAAVACPLCPPAPVGRGCDSHRSMPVLTTRNGRTWA